MADIIIHAHGRERLTTPETSERSLAQTLFLLGLWEDVPLCSGLGKCGLCRVRYLSDAPKPHREEAFKFSREELAAGWRLSCLHPSEKCRIELPAPMRTQKKTTLKSTGQGDFSLAVDLGTTSIHWTALMGADVIARGTRLNPQMGLGSEIMSRLAFAAHVEGARTLRELVLAAIHDIITTLEASLNGHCSALAVSGNPAMTSILLDLDVSGLATAPYRLDYSGDEQYSLESTLPPAFIPPLFAPFVGADLSAGLAALHFSGSPPRYPYMLADLGTNGEFILALSPEEHICASVPMGPALEGVGLSAGRMAGPGAISAFSHSPAGIAPRRIPGAEDPMPQGMTGTGYLSLAALLLKNGVLDDNGLYQSGSTPQGNKLARRISRDGAEPTFEVLPGMNMPASDLEEILKVKAAFNLALSRLLKEADLAPADLTTLYLAGALGEHVDLGDLETLGFLPPGMKDRTVRAGNTSLLGTERLLTEPEARSWLSAIPATIRTLELTGDENFGAHYMKRMRFTYVD